MQLIAFFPVMWAMTLATTMAGTTNPMNNAATTENPRIMATDADPIKNLDAKLNQLLQMMSTMSQTLAQHESNLNIHKSALYGIKSNIQTLTTELNDLGKTVSDLKSHNEERMNNITRVVYSQNSKIASMQSTLNSHNTNISQQKRQAAYKKRLVTREENSTAPNEMEDLKETVARVAEMAASNKERLNMEEQTMASIGNQLMQQQTFVEERIRTDGTSGIKTVRQNRYGTQPYYGFTHIGGAALSAHDHAEFDRTIGLGEFSAVMNGVDFRTRHNDYRFVKPTSSPEYNSVEDIPFPDVPPEVSNKTTLEEQIVEMRQWFKAFKDQNDSVRDYRKYFKPNLCYLEGGWTRNTKNLSEPFDSDRHHLDAQTWFELQEKIRFTSYTGGKSNLENFAYLPTTMYNYINGTPRIAQWNYRILCHPLQQDVPTKYFKVQDDLATRMAKRYTWERVPNIRVARFKLNEFDDDRATSYTLLDSLMNGIPGKNNYGNNLTDDSFGKMHYNVSGNRGANKELNAGYYHRSYKLLKRGAMGLQINQRGFRDENLWVALTTQPNIMPMSIKVCRPRPCRYQTKRVTYALPLEIVYTTPLQSWNPLNLTMNKVSVVTKNNRRGGINFRTAYNGSSFRHYYRTPVEFYKDGKVQRDKADTARRAVGVLDENGELQRAAPTGFRIMTPQIQDVGRVRIRYPIFPVHSEGSVLGEEVAALKKMVMNMSGYDNLFENPPVFGDTTTQHGDVYFEVRETSRDPPGRHGHNFTLTAAQYKALLNGKRLSVTTSNNLGHDHELTIYYNKTKDRFFINRCDGQNQCSDGHPIRLRRV